uniref:Uncharacterized protein n=1 Tax=Neolamprologus brichardi TaxID=32507 RepID=A0A3Q4GQ42_NEOBR
MGLTQLESQGWLWLEGSPGAVCLPQRGAGSRLCCSSLVEVHARSISCIFVALFSDPENTVSAYFQDNFSIKSKCQNSLCHSTS